ncbi:MAG: hypothetical protein HY919_03945 [Elusimicrobia bacterium]|nr:hypothetical protein [Elusimicrobiota bacterium]
MFQLKTLSGNSDKIVFPIFAFVLAVFLILLIFHREVVIDEGVYLYAGKLVSEGKIPYLDFAHVQGPLFPFFYGIINLLIGSDIFINRIITAFFGFCGLIFAGLIVRKIGGNIAAIIFFLFCLTSVYMLSHYVVVATYGITAFFLYLAIYLALNKNCIFLSYFFLGITLSIRLSTAILVPVFIFYFIISNKKKTKISLEYSLILILLFCAIFLPFIIKAPNVFFYNILGKHLTILSIKQRLLMTGSVFFANIKDYAVLLLVTLLSFLSLIKTSTENFSKFLFLFLVFIFLFIANLLPVASRGSYYNSLNLPILFMIIGLATAKMIKTEKKIAAVIPIILFMNFAEQSVLVKKHKLISEENAMTKIKEEAKFIEMDILPSRNLLTFSTLLTVQSNLNIPIEFAEDCFSYKGDWLTDKCKKYKRVNNEIFMDYVSDKGIRLIALGDFDLYQFGENKKIILQKMEKSGFTYVKKIENFGQWHDNLYIFTRK